MDWATRKEMVICKRAHNCEDDVLEALIQQKIDALAEINQEMYVQAMLGGL